MKVMKLHLAVKNFIGQLAKVQFMDFVKGNQ
jgi:hypothetical protein